MNMPLLLERFKKVFKSLTIWFNGVMLAAIPFWDNLVRGLNENMQTFSQWLTPERLKTLAIFILVSNIVLRFKTNKDLKDK